MTFSITQHGVSVLYNCRHALLNFGKKCKDKNIDKCKICKYCKAEMSAYDATKLLRSFQKRMNK